MEPNEKLAYIAGLVDGEGTLTINACKSHKKGIHWLTPIIQIDSTNLNVLEFAQKIIGGKICQYAKCDTKSGIKRRDGYALRIYGRDKILEVAQLLLPYLQIKKPNAEIIIEFCKSRKAQLINSNKRRVTYSIAEINLAKEIRTHNIKRKLDTIFPDSFGSPYNIAIKLRDNFA